MLNGARYFLSARREEGANRDSGLPSNASVEKKPRFDRDSERSERFSNLLLFLFFADLSLPTLAPSGILESSTGPGNDRFIQISTFSWDFPAKFLGKPEEFLQVPPPHAKQEMVALRLTRKGTKDQPYYKIVAVDSRKRRDGRYIEQIGSYDPMREGVNYSVDLEKVDTWLGQGAQPSETVNSLIKKARKIANADSEE